MEKYLVFDIGGTFIKYALMDRQNALLEQNKVPSPVDSLEGGISARPEVTDAIRQAVDEQFAAIPFTPFGKPEIVRCKYGNDANLIGALRFHLGCGA